MWGNSIALLFKGEVVLGVSYLPVFDELYWAQKGCGAFCNDRQIWVSEVNQMQRAIVSHGDFNVGDDWIGNNDKILGLMKVESEFCQRIKSIGSAIIETCFVASGRLDVYAMAYSHPWDIAAGVLLVQEAGGKVSLWNGEAVEIVDEVSVLFANTHLFEEFLKYTLEL
jgi:myo-inositol-1(or 4)-monophosphatase